MNSQYSSLTCFEHVPINITQLKEGDEMRRKSPIPYGETTILSLLNIASGTKFQLITKVKNANQSKVTVTDDNEDLEIEIEEEELSDLEVGETIIVFGEKLDSGIKKEHIIKLNLDWDLYWKTREFELR